MKATEYGINSTAVSSTYSGEQTEVKSESEACRQNSRNRRSRRDTPERPSGRGISLIAAAAALIHETGHILAARLFGVPSAGGKNIFFGLSLKYDFSSVSFFKEAAVSFAGPLFNVASFVITFLVSKSPGTYAVFFMFSNLSLALFNLLPVSPLDGSEILKALLMNVAPPNTAERIAAWTSAVFSLAFFAFCAYVQLKIGANLSLLFISVYLLYNAFNSVKSAQYEREP